MVFFFVTCSYQHRLYVVGNLVFIVGNLVLLDVMDIIVIELECAGYYYYGIKMESQLHINGLC